MNVDVSASEFGSILSGPDGYDSAALIRQIADRAPAVMVAADALTHRIVYANKAAERAARSAADPLIGRKATDAFAFVDCESLRLTEDGTAHPCTVLDRESGEPIWWDVSCSALDCALSDTPIVLITAVDVTHHETARLRAVAAQDTLDALLDYIPEGISIAHGREVHVDRISARGKALLGRTESELTDRSALQQTDVWEVYRPGSEIPLAPGDRPLARATRTGKVTLNETLLVRCASGAMLPLLCNSGPIRDAASRVTGAVMTWQDATELQRAQAALRQR